MADFRIRLVVDPFQAQKSFQQVELSMERIERRTNRLRDGLGTFLRSAGVLLLTQQLAALGDEYTTLQNRIRFVTSSQAELAAITERLTRIANGTRLALSSVGTLFTRLAVNSRELGLSFDNILGFTKSLNQAIILSGATVKEANAALIQLSQGLASGALRGDELRSVLEQLPFVADIIARRFKVTRGELRGLGQDGALVSSEIVGAFQDVAAELEELFKKTVPTLSQSFEVLRNKVLEFIGVNDQANGVTAKLSKTILFLAENIETLARIITTVLVAKALGALIATLGRLRIALLKNPLTLLASGAALAVGAIVGFGDQLDILGDGVTNLQDVVVSAFNNIVAAFKDADLTMGIMVASMAAVTAGGFALASSVTKAGGALALLGTIIKRNAIFLLASSALAAVVAVFLVVDAIQTLSDQIDRLNRKTALAEQLKATSDQLARTGLEITLTEERYDRLRKTLQRRFASGAAQIGPEFEVLRNEITRTDEKLKSLKAARAKGIDDITVLTKEFDAVSGGKRIGDELAAGIEQSGLQGLLNKIFDDAAARGQQRLDDAGQVQQGLADLSQSGQAADPAALSDRLRDLEKEAELLLLVGDYSEQYIAALRVQQEVGGKLNEEQRTRLQGAVVEVEVLKQQVGLLNQLNGPREALINGQRNLGVLLDSGLITQEQYNDKLRDMAIAAEEASKTVGGSLTAAILRMQQELTNAQIASDIFTSGVNTAADALTEFVTKGKADIKAFASAFLADITRIIARLLILQAIEASIGAFGGGAANAAVNVAARAHGGPVQANRAYLVGEEGPEFIIPRGAGTVIPADRSAALLAGEAGPRGTGAAPPPNVNVSVVNSLDPSLALQAMDSPRGHKVILNAITAQKRQVQSVLS